MSYFYFLLIWRFLSTFGSHFKPFLFLWWLKNCSRSDKSSIIEIFCNYSTAGIWTLKNYHARSSLTALATGWWKVDNRSICFYTDHFCCLSFLLCCHSRCGRSYFFLFPPPLFKDFLEASPMPLLCKRSHRAHQQGCHQQQSKQALLLQPTSFSRYQPGAIPSNAAKLSFSVSGGMSTV